MRSYPKALLCVYPIDFISEELGQMQQGADEENPADAQWIVLSREKADGGDSYSPRWKDL